MAVSCFSGDLECLYSKTIPAYIRTGERDQRVNFITVSVYQSVLKNASYRKELHIKLTDDKDPFFLLSLILGEEDFQNLKAQQGLLVDFSAFPHKFIGLLDSCLKEDGSQAPKFQFHLSLPVISGVQAQMDINEINPLRSLTHLSLRLLTASEADINRYLASCLKALKESHEQLQNQFKATQSDLTSRLESSEHARATKTAELDRARMEFNDQLYRLKAQHTEEMAAGREALHGEQKDLERQHETRRRDLETKFTRAMHDREAQISSLELDNKTLQERKNQLENLLRDYKARVSSLEADLGSSRKDMEASRRESHALTARCDKLELDLCSATARLNARDTEFEDRDDRLKKLNAHADELQAAKIKMEEQRDTLQVQLKKRECNVKTLSEEVNKANHIIVKLQSQAKGYFNTWKSGLDQLAEQDKQLSDARDQVCKLRDELHAAKDQMRSRDDEFRRLQDELQRSKDNLDARTKDVEKNERLVSFLQKQLNETALKQHGSGLPSSSYVSPQYLYSASGGPSYLDPSRTAPSTGSALNTLQFVSPIEVPFSAISDHKTNKENDPPLPEKYFQPPSKPNPSDVRKTGSDIRHPMTSQPGRRPAPLKAIPIPSAPFRPTRPSSAYFPSQASGL